MTNATADRDMSLTDWIEHFEGKRRPDTVTLAELVASIEEAPAVPVVGLTYLVCFRNADGSKAHVGHAGHYLGSTYDLVERLATHTAGKGSALTGAAVAAGLVLRVTRTWEGVEHETRMKYRGDQGGACRQSRSGKRFGVKRSLTRSCPDCRRGN